MNLDIKANNLSLEQNREANKKDHFKMNLPSSHISVRFNYRPTVEEHHQTPKTLEDGRFSAFTEGYNAGGINVVSTL
jgi:hypothetical protein